MSYVEFKDVKKVYKTGEVEINALRDVDFEIEKGEFCVIVGASGAGKTTILNILGGMDTLTSGSVKLDGREISTLNKRQLTAYRRYDVGFVFQFYNLVQNLTALENVELASQICKAPLPADDVLRQGVQSISDLVNATGLVNSDFADVTEIMKDAGYAHMGVGRAKGKDKAEVAAKQAITSPLLNTSIEGARGVLLNITASTDIGLEEIDAASTIVTNAVHPDCEIIWGANFDEELEDEMIITFIATRFGDEGPNHQIKSTTANLEVAPPVTEPVAPTTAAPSAFTNSDDDAFDQIVDFFKK